MSFGIAMSLKASSRFMQDAHPPARPGRLGPPVRVYQPDLPGWFCRVFSALSPLLLLSLVLHPPPSPLSLLSIRPLFPCL
eukprot:7688507-Pyramimonas_sp.AAC.1